MYQRLRFDNSYEYVTLDKYECPTEIIFRQQEKRCALNVIIFIARVKIYI